MAKRNEVDLVIKAKNEASKTLKAVVAAFEEFKGTMSEAKDASAKGNATLGDLAKTLLNLNKQAAGLKALDSVSKNLNEASAAAAKLETAVRDGAEELGRMAVESALAADRTKRLRSSLDAEQSTLRALTAERRDANKTLRESESEIKAVARAQQRLAQTQKQQRTTGVGLDIGQAQTSARDSASVFLSGAADKAAKSFAEAQQYVKLYDDEITQTKKNIALFDVAVKSASDQQRRLEADTNKQTGALRQNRNALADTATELEQIRKVVSDVEAATGRQITTQQRVTDAYQKTAAEIERVQKLASVMSRYSTGSGNFADPKTAAALQKQNDAIREAEQNWKTLESEARRLAEGMKTVSGNATAQVNAFKQIIGASRAARAEYNAQVAALAKMQGSAKSSFLAWSQAAGGFRAYTAAAQPVASASNAAAGGIKAMAQSAGGAAQAIRDTTNASRNALSFYQRMRSEVIALTASYIGLRGGAQQLMAVVDATNTLEAAQSRLNVAFNGDNRRVAAELAFLGQQADRLGISLDTLATQYSRFAVAAKTANFSTATTRDLFLSVAEAGRVQRLSIDELNGIFKALEQIMSKGKVQAEELRGQLGDRMTGAFKLFADAIGVTTAELDDMLKKGEVVASEDNLSSFANRLRQVYGVEVPNALKSTNAELGRFEKNIFNARVAVGEGGFSQAFADALRTLNEAISSNEGIEFFTSLGVALGKITTVVTALIPHLDDLATVLGLIAAAKAGTWFAGFADRVRASAVELGRSNASLFTWQSTVMAARGNWNAMVGTLNVATAALTRNRVELTAVGTQAVSTSTRMAVMRGTITALQTVAGAAAGTFRLLWAAIGGLPGIVLTGVTLAIGSWLTKVDATNSAITEHERILRVVQNAYTEIEGTTKKVADNIKGATEAQALASVDKLRTKFDGLVSSMQSLSRVLYAGFSDFGANSAQLKQFRQIEDALKRVKDGSGTIEELSRVLNDIALNPSDPQFKEIALQLLDMVNAAGEGETSLQDLYDALQRGEAIVKAFSGAATDADKALINGAESTGKAADAQERAAKQTEAFKNAMDEMGKLIPSVADELERLGDIDSLNKIYQDAVKAARSMGELQLATKQYNTALDGINLNALGGTGLEASMNLIKSFEGFSATPYWDKNAFRVGYGSDTVTLSDNSVHRVVEGMRVSIQDANRDLVRRIQEFQTTVKSEIGTDRFNAMSPEQQAALTSVAYNYGNLTRTGQLDAFKNGTVSEIADAIRKLGSDNGGINAGRRNKEAAVFEQAGTSYQLEQQRYELQTKGNEATKKRIADQEFEIKQQQMINDGKKREAAQEAAVRDAKAENKNLTDEQIAKIRELAGLEFDLKNTKTEQKEEQRQANQLVKEAQALYQQQIALQAQLKQQQGLGDVTAADQTKLKLQEVSAQFEEAIQKARAMWEAIGGAEAKAKLATLDTLATKIQTATSRTNSFGLTSQQVSGFVDTFASGIANAFGSFAQAVVNGENAFKAFGKAVLQTLAQVLQQIAVAILRMMILKALSGFGGGIGAAAGSLLGGVAHGGGVAGSTNRSRSVSAGMLASPFVYHTGGVAGLKSDEVVSVLQRGETIRTAEQEAALAEKQAMADRVTAAQGNGGQTIRNIITLDEESAKNWLTSSAGEKAILSVLGNNRSKLRGLVGA
jgi:tape measure domain-containing protein